MLRPTLLAVCGLSPQVITETVFALAKQHRLPSRIRILTTRSGRQVCVSELFDGGCGAWYRMLEDLQISAGNIDFSPDAVQLVKTTDGRPIDDIDDEADNEAFVNACLRLAWHYSREAKGSVYYSIAGGRKTMGAALAFAAQAYGRSQDRIFHVLVSSEFESNRDFYYPPKEPQEIELRDAKGDPVRKSTRYARIELVALPFFSFRDRLGEEILDQPRDPATLISSLVREDPEQLVVDLMQRKLVWKGRECDLRPSQLALYALFVEIRKEADCASDCPGCADCWPTAAELLARQHRLSSLYRSIDPRREPAEMSDSGIFNLTLDNFQSYLSKIRKKLELGFGAIEAPKLLIYSRGKRPTTGYGLKLNKDQIVLIR
jgi:CRISPR-associated protein Csx14